MNKYLVSVVKTVDLLSNSMSGNKEDKEKARKIIWNCILTCSELYKEDLASRKDIQEIYHMLEVMEKERNNGR